MNKGVIISMACLSATMAGCGGGSGGGAAAPPPGGAPPFISGNLVGRGAATNPPVTTAAQTTVATGITGNFTQLKLRDQSLDLDDTRLAITSFRSGGGDGYTINIDGTDPFQVTKSQGVQEADVAFSPGGNKIAYTGAVASFDRDIFLFRTDGTFLARVTNTAGTPEYHPAWSPDGSKIVFERQFEVPSPHLVIYTVSGATEIVPDMGGNAWDPVWSSQNQIAFVTSRNGDNDIYVASPTGVGVVKASNSSDDEDTPAWSPDGDTLYYVDHGVGVNTLTARHTTFFSTSWGPIYSTADSITSLTVSPDGEWVAFLDGKDVVRVHRTGGSPSTLYSSPDSLFGVSWGPFSPDRLVVGVGGLLATTASGFIYSDAGSRTQSVLVFNAVTPSSAILRAMTGIGGTEDSLLFTVDADTLNLMTYANAPVWNTVPVIQGGTSTPSANGAIISIGSFDGKVNAVLPFNGSRSADSKPTVTRQGSTYVFSGQFLSATNGAGKNVAPSGATRIVLDPKTGVLTAG